MALFKKEDNKKKGTPMQEVLDMKKKGMPDNQIIKTLQDKGYNSQNIFNALSQADIKSSATGGPPQQQQQQQPPQPEVPAPQGPPRPQQQQPPQPKSQKSDSERIEEIAEAIIDEKWDELAKSINKIIDWKNDMDSKLSEMEEKTQHLQENFDKLHKSIVSKIDDYDKNLSNVGAELKALNKVFEKMMPEFTENIQKLSRYTKKISKKKKKSKSKKK